METKRLAPWSGLTADEMQLLETTFWSAGGSRHGMAERLGFSKSKANALIAGLVEQGLLAEAGLQRSVRRAPRRNPAAARAASACWSASTSAPPASTWPCCAPDLSVLAQHARAGRRARRPGRRAGPRARADARAARRGAASTRRQVIGIGIGVPGPVNFEIGQLVNPPLMPDWDSFSIRDYLREDYAAPVFVDNDVNLMALGELWRLQRSLSELPRHQGRHRHRLRHRLPWRGVPRRGRLGRRRRPHLRRPGRPALPLRQPRLRRGDGGRPGHHAHGRCEAARSRREPLRWPSACARSGRIEAIDVGQASRAGDAAANAIVQRAGSLIGQMLASVVNFFNPSHVFIGGGITRIGPLFLAAVRQSVYQRSLALSTRHLEIQYTPLGAQAGLIGAGVLAMHETLKVRGVAP